MNFLDFLGLGYCVETPQKPRMSRPILIYEVVGSCCRCLRFLVLEPQTDHAESCEIMADHAKSFCLKVPDFA